MTTVIIAHIMFTISFIVVAVKARLQGMDPSLEQAAQDLYASPRATFRYVTFPLVAPGIAGAALLGFALSFDDFIISFFNAGTLVTFPIYIWGAAQRGIPVQVNALATLVSSSPWHRADRPVRCVAQAQGTQRRDVPSNWPAKSEQRTPITMDSAPPLLTPSAELANFHPRTGKFLPANWQVSTRELARFWPTCAITRLE